jgi:hypothetical protein
MGLSHDDASGFKGLLGQASEAMAGADPPRRHEQVPGHFADPKDAVRAHDKAALKRSPDAMTNAMLGLLEES